MSRAEFDLEAVALESCADELLDGSIYRALSRAFFVPAGLRGFMARFASQEEDHHRFWRSVLGRDCSVSFLRLKILGALMLALLFGLTVAVKILERKEKETITKYRKALALVEGAERAELERIIEEEERHEETLLEGIGEKRIKYLGFIVLGLSDAIIEISGIHAGTLGFYSDTVKAGIAGLIAGVSASMAMATAAYAQAKQGGMGRPGTSAAYTGIAYIFTAVALAIPYFLVHDMLLALIISIGISVIIIAYSSVYGTVLQGRRYSREVGETTGIILGVSAALYLFGEVVRRFLGISV